MFLSIDCLLTIVLLIFSAARQLAGLLVLQRVCDRRQPLTHEFATFFDASPDDFSARLLKLATRKQLDLLRDRLPSASLSAFVRRVRGYLQFNNIVSDLLGAKLTQQCSECRLRAVGNIGRSF